MIFAGGLIFFIGLMAIVIDVSWIWANTLRVQRTADAAALAGSPYLPASTVNAYKYAVAEAAKNGYTLTNGCKADNMTPSSVPGICASQDSVAVVGGDPRQLDVTVSAQVDILHANLRDQHDYGEPDGEGDLCPAGPDGEPGELLRHLLPHDAIQFEL